MGQRILVLVLAIVATVSLASVSLADKPSIPSPSDVFRLLQDDGGPTAPEEWAGIWDITIEIRDCDTNALLSSFSEQDTICVGDEFLVEEDDDELPTDIACSGTVGGTTVDYTCTGDFEVFTGCTGTFTIDIDAEVSTSGTPSYTATSTSTLTYTGATCGPLEDQCTRSVVTGVKVADQPDTCAQVPVETVRWGTMKALYR